VLFLLTFFLDSFRDAVTRIFQVAIFTSIVGIAATCLLCGVLLGTRLATSEPFDCIMIYVILCRSCK
jgi:hypothetical protein